MTIIFMRLGKTLLGNRKIEKNIDAKREKVYNKFLDSQITFLEPLSL